MALSYIEIEVEEETFHIFTLPDRRPTAGSSQPIKWLYQMIVESYLYHNGEAEAKEKQPESLECWLCRKCLAPLARWVRSGGRSRPDVQMPGLARANHL